MPQHEVRLGVLAWTRKLATTLVLVSGLAAGDRAGADQITIGILRFQHTPQVSVDAAKSIEQFVYSGFSEQQRFRLLERARLDALSDERAMQQAVDVVNPLKLRELGADFVVLGEVTSSEVARHHDAEMGTWYEATVAYGLRIIDVSSGAVAYSEDFSSVRGNPFGGLINFVGGDKRTPGGALDIALRKTQKPLLAFIAQAFAVTGQVVSVESIDRKGAASSVLVSLGVADGVDRKTVLSAFTSESLRVGEQDLVRKKPLGELLFVESQGDHLSVFKLRKASPELGAAVGAGTTVRVEFKR